MAGTSLDRLFTHPKRNWIVMTATLTAGLIFLLPAVDSLNTERSRCSELRASLDEGREEITGLDTWKQRLGQQIDLLHQFESRAFAAVEVEAFRSELLDRVRSTNCTMRRIRVSDPRFRDWMGTDDDPLADGATESDEYEDESSFLLETRQLLLVAEGPLDNIRHLLAEIQSTERLIHFSSVSIREAEDGPGEVSLELELLLFNLVQKQFDDDEEFEDE